MDSAQPLSDREKLERYVRFAQDLRDELAETDQQLKDMKAQGRTKTATYQQLFANRLTASCSRRWSRASTRQTSEPVSPLAK